MSSHGTAFSDGQTMEVVSTILRALPGALINIDPKTLIPAVTTDGVGLTIELKRLMVNMLRRSFPKSRLVILANQGVSINQLMSQGRLFGPQILTSNLQRTRSGIYPLVLESFSFSDNQTITPKEVLVRISRLGGRPIDVIELLTIACEYSDLPGEYPIVALGSPTENPTNGKICFPALKSEVGRRIVYLRETSRELNMRHRIPYATN